MNKIILFLVFNISILLSACTENSSDIAQNKDSNNIKYDTLIKDYLQLLEKEKHHYAVDFNTMLLRLLLLNDTNQVHAKTDLINALKNRFDHYVRFKKLDSIYENALQELPLSKYLKNNKKGSVVRLNLWQAFYPYETIIRLELKGDSSQITKKLISYNYNIDRCNSGALDSLYEGCFSIKEEQTKKISKTEAKYLFEYIFLQSDLQYLKSDAELKPNICLDGANYKIEALEKYDFDAEQKFTIERHCPGSEGPLVKVANLLLSQFEEK